VPVPVTPLAARLDADVVAAPSTAPPEVPAAEVPTIGGLSVRAGPGTRQLDLALDVARPPGTARVPMVKLYTDGDVTAGAGGLTYPPAGADDLVTVYAIAANRLAAQRRFRVSS
jgi:hypothetical protein